MVAINEALKGVKVLFIETSPFIYLIESYPNYEKRVDPIFEKIQNGDIQGLTSAITVTEILPLPPRTGNLQLEQRYRDILLNSRNLLVLDISTRIAEQAARLRAQYNLRTPDAFLTNDRGLLRVNS